MHSNSKHWMSKLSKVAKKLLASLSYSTNMILYTSLLEETLSLQYLLNKI